MCSRGWIGPEMIYDVHLSVARMGVSVYMLRPVPCVDMHRV